MRPLFVTNTARGGSYLTSQILSANKDITIASEPYLELFRSLRNSILKGSDEELLPIEKVNSLPFLDYYYRDNNRKIIDFINNSDIDVECTQEEWERVYKLQVKRLELQCPELIPTFNEMQGKSYLEIINNSFELIRNARHLPEQKWVGIKDAWIIELFFPLARSFPDSKFIVILRDPRASIASNLLVKNKSMVAHVASFARAWRKNVAYSLYLRQQPEFKDRIHFISYEKMVRNPSEEVGKVCDFLDIEFCEDMLNTDNFIDYATGEIWRGNSSYENETKGISEHRIDRWKGSLSENALAAVEFICGNDLRFIERETYGACDTGALDHNALDFFIEDNFGYKDWRTDSGFAEMEYGYEAARNTMLLSENSDYSETSINKFFLFKECFEELRKRESTSLFS